MRMPTLFVVVLSDPGLDVAMTVHDTRALKRFGETAGLSSIQFVDYLVISAVDALRNPLSYSSNATGRLTLTRV